MSEPVAGSGSGRFQHDTWWIHTPGDDPRSAQYASAHESHHQQLEATTAFGNLTRIMVYLERIGAPVHPGLVADLVGSSRGVHEAFASWVPAFVLGWTREQISETYPEYLRDYDAMDALVAHARSPFLRLHLAHGIARLCMQSGVLEVATTVGLEAMRLADLRSALRPDARFRTLRRSPPAIEKIEQDTQEWLIEAASGTGQGTDRRATASRALVLLAEPALTAQMLAPEERDSFVLVSALIYALLEQHARSVGQTSLGYEEHVLAAKPVLAAAQELAGAEISLVSGDVSPGPAWTDGLVGTGAAGTGVEGAPEDGQARVRFEVQAHARRAVGSIDFEQFSVAAPLEARWMGADTPLAEMVAGVDDPHLFVAVRTLGQLRQNYRWTDGAAVPGVVGGGSVVLRDGPADELGAIAFVRRTVAEESTDAGCVVELVDVTGSMPARSEAPVPVVTSVAMSLLGTPLATRLAEYTRSEISTLLVDIPLEPHLNLWLSGEGTRVRWVLLRTEGHGRVVPVLILRVENDGARSHLMIKPVSHAAAGIYRAGFEEVDPAGERLVADPGLLEDEPALLELTLSHLVGEEVWFGAG